MEIRADSLEYAKATITADHDLTGDVIEVAMPETGTDPATWFTAAVVAVADNGNGTFTATYRVLLGPAGAITLTKGTTYDWLVKVTDSPEAPIRKTGTVTAT